MRIASLLAFALLVPACGSGGESAAPVSPPTKPLLGIVWSDVTGTIVHLDSRTLRPLPGRRVPLSGHGGPSAFSPNRSQVAFAGEESVRIVDVERMKVVTDIETAPGVGELAWLGPRRLLAVSGWEWEHHGTQLAVIDPLAQHIVATARVDGVMEDSVTAPDGLVLLLAPIRGIGHARLVFFSARGDARSVVLDRVDAGWSAEELTDELLVDHYQMPGVTFDPERGRAYVVTSGRLVAEVDTETMSVRYHTLQAGRSLVGRVRAWLDPAAQAKGASDGSLRRALWLGDGRLAVYGWDHHAALDGDGNPEQTTTAAGLVLVDTDGWSTRGLLEGATEADIVGDTLLAYGNVYDGATLRGIGLHAFTRAGEHRFHVLEDKPIAEVAAVGRHVYLNVESDWCEKAVVDIAAGRVWRDVETWQENCFRPSLLLPDR